MLELAAMNYTRCFSHSFEPLPHLITNAFVLPVIVGFGIASNMADIWVFSRKQRRLQPINMFLLVLSIIDLCSLVSSFGMLSIPALFTLKAMGNQESVMSLYVANIFRQIFLPAVHFCQSVSMWLTVTLTAHKFIG